MNDETLAMLNRLVAEINALEQSGRMLTDQNPAAADATVDAIAARVGQLRNLLEHC